MSDRCFFSLGSLPFVAEKKLI